MLRVVLDTVVFVRALLKPGNRAGQLLFEHANDYTLVLSPSIIQEILEVLNHPEIARKFRTADGIDMRQVLDVLAEAEIVEFYQIPTISRDPKDDKFLATARAGDVQYLVSEDRDLLDLNAYEGVTIIDTASFLSLLAGDQET